MTVTAAKRTGMSVPSNKPSGPAVVDRGQQASRFTPRAGLAGQTSGLPAARRAGPFFYFWNSTKSHLGPLHDISNHIPPQLFSFSVSFHRFHSQSRWNIIGVFSCNFNCGKLAMLKFQSHSTWNTSITFFRFDRLPFVRPFLSCYLHRMVTNRLTAVGYSFSNLLCASLAGH